MNEGFCLVCQKSIRTDKYIIPTCGHSIHGKCIVSYYKQTHNYYDFETQMELKPKCHCSQQIRRKDLPGWKPWKPNRRQRELIREPARSAMGRDAPFRLTRMNALIRRNQVLDSLNDLVKQRDKLKQAKRNEPMILPERRSNIRSPVTVGKFNQSVIDPQPSTSSGQRGNRKSPVIVEISSESSASQRSELVISSQYRPSPNYQPTNDYLNRAPANYSDPQPLSPIHGHSSPTNELRPEDLLEYIYGSEQDQEDKLSAICANDSVSQCPVLPTNEVARLLQPVHDSYEEDLQDYDMRIGIMNWQLQALQSFEKPNDEENFQLPDNQSEASEDDIAESGVEVVGIIGSWGRGSSICYLLLWSDGKETLNKCAEVEASLKLMLDAWRLNNRKMNTRRSRARKKHREINGDNCGCNDCVLYRGKKNRKNR